MVTAGLPGEKVRTDVERRELKEKEDTKDKRKERRREGRGG